MCRVEDRTYLHGPQHPIRRGMVLALEMVLKWFDGGMLSRAEIVAFSSVLERHYALEVLLLVA